MDQRLQTVWPGWETVRIIGRGSYGAVYEIRRDSFGVSERAAVKCISLPSDPGEIEDMLGTGYTNESVSAHYEGQLRQIVQEYRLMAELKNCHYVVRSEDLLQQHQDNGLGWDVKIKMELLTPMMRAKVPGDMEQQALRLGHDLCLALIECKNHSIVHRDIKPQNIFLAENGDYKLGDFGIARTMERTTGATKTGTYNYMAPEVYNNAPYGHQADVYSLGMVLYWMLNENRGPFLPLPPQIPTATQQEQARLRRFAGEPLPPPKNGSEGLKAIVLKACSGDPKQRFAHAGELYNELEALRRAEKERATPGGATGQNPSGPAGHLPLQGRQEKTGAKAASSTVGTDALGGPMGGEAAKQNPSGPEGHLHPPLCPPRGHLSPPGRVFPLQGRQEKAVVQDDRKAGKERIAVPVTPSPVRDDKTPAKTTGKDPSTPLRSAQDDKTGARDDKASKPKKKSPVGLILGLAAALLLIAALLLVPRLRDGAGGLFSRGVSYEADGLRYTVSGTTLTVSGEGEIGKPGNVIPDWSSLQESLTVLRIKEGVTGVGDYAFQGCTALTDAELPDSLSSLGAYAFYKCGALRSVRLPAGLTELHGGVFNGCGSLESVEIPETVTSIGSFAFRDCAALQSVTLPEGLRDLGESAFYGCTALTAARVPDGITKLNAGTFCGCSSLAELTLPDGITVIGNHALGGCAFKTLILPRSLGKLGAYALSGNRKLTALILPESLGTLGESCFYGCSALLAIHVPEGVTSIPERTFHGCSSLRSVSLPGTLTTIGDHAFQGCRELELLAVPDGTTKLGINFLSASSVAELYLPASLTSKYTSQFVLTGANCLEAVYFAGRQSQWTELPISRFVPEGAALYFETPAPADMAASAVTADGMTYTVTAGQTLFVTGAGEVCPAQSIPNWAEIQENITTVIIGEGATGLAAGAFRGCTALRDAVLPASLTGIADDAFRDCLALTHLELPRGLTYLGQNIFNGCYVLESVTLPIQLGALDLSTGPDGSFYKCPALTDIYYPGSEEEAAAYGGFGDLAALHIHYDADGAQPERTEA